MSKIIKIKFRKPKISVISSVPTTTMINRHIKNSRMCLLCFCFSYVITQPAISLKKRIACNFIKKERFPVNFPKFLRTFFLAEHLRQLLLLALVKPCSKVRLDLHLREFFFYRSKCTQKHKNSSQYYPT